MKLVSLNHATTSPTPTTVFINPEQVIAVYQHGKNVAIITTSYKETGNSIIYVRNSLTDVVKALQNT